MKEHRPRIKISLTRTDKIVELTAWLTLFVLWVLPLIHYGRMPDIIPTHFNFAMEADAWGKKTSIFILPIIGTLLFAGMTWLNNYPHIFNYPVKITPENAERQYRIATRLIRLLRLAIIFIFSLIAYITIQTAYADHSGNNPWLSPMILGLIYSPLLFYLFASLKQK